LTKIEENDKIAVENLLNSKLGQNQGESLMASLAEKWYHDGEIKGKAEGEYNKAIEIAKKLLSKDNSITGIAYLTGLSIAEIEKLKG
jgi:predicted transposase/invertase (TIGR01784 family)